MKRLQPLLALAIFLIPAFGWTQGVDFNREVRPILSDKCYHCHGPDQQNRKAGLRLDTPEGAAKVVKGDSVEATKLYKRITHANPEKRMPPADANFNKVLTAKEIDILKQWLTGGAKYARHWAFEKPFQAILPEVADPEWQRPIDRFIVARLQKEGLKPNPRADRATLLRRVTLDLTGLPPTPQEIEAFLKDRSADAYEKVVDRLLQSPRYGERMTLFWMDLARYGDSSVYHADGNRDMWGWRDGVIRSFNENQPFDQFTIEQLAGDLIPNATVAQKVASGFNRNHATTDEGGVIPEEFRVDYVVDRVKTVSNTWLALSMECSQCHDHKYDPLSQREYYQFYAFFNSTKDGGMQTRGGNSAPVVTVPDMEALANLDRVKAARHSAETELAKYRAAWQPGKEFADWLAKQNPKAAPLHRSPEFVLPLAPQGKTSVLVASDGQFAIAPGPLAEAKRPQGAGVKFDGKTGLTFVKAFEFDASQPFTFTVWLQVPAKGGGGPILSSMDKDAGFQFSIDDFKPTIWIKNGMALKVTGKAKLTPGAWHHLVFSGDGKKSAKGVRIHVDGKQIDTQIIEDRLGDAPGFARRKPLHFAEVAGGAKFNGSLDALAFFRGEFTDEQILSAGGDLVARLLARPERSDRDAILVDHYLRTVDGRHAQLLKTFSQAIDAERSLKAGTTSVMVMEDLPQMRPTYILNRGQYDQPLKDKLVQPGVPAILPPLPKDAPANRLGMARWLFQPDHPLTGRVAVNRFWQLLFGEGLVRTSEDFGLQGEMPSHSELLDWLAVDFAKSGWDVKRAMKQIVMSSTYCQESRLTPKVREADPQNRLLARAPRLRLQAEFIRDNFLFVSGLLVDKVGGKSVKPYQPDGLWTELSMGGPGWVADKGDKLYRRSMYTYWKRSVPHPSMMTFDAPTREKCSGYRARTNTPLQALVTLNDPQFVEAARVFAQRILKQSGAGPRERIQFAYLHALGRPASEKEVGLIEKLLVSQRGRFDADPKKADALLKVGESPRDPLIPAVEHAAWTMVASTILNLDEFLVKN